MKWVSVAGVEVCNGEEEASH